MKVIKKLFIAVLVLMFLGVLAIFVKTYIDIRDSKEYIEFITNSANEFLVEIEQINHALNDFEYSETQQSVVELESRLEKTEELYENVKISKGNYKVPYKGENVEEEFNIYLENVGQVIDSYEGLINVVKDLEDKEIFDASLEEYITDSNDLQEGSETLEQRLNEYVGNYTKFDLNRVLYGINFI